MTKLLHLSPFAQALIVALVLLLHLQMSRRTRHRLRRSAWAKSGAFGRMVERAAVRRGVVL